MKRTMKIATGVAAAGLLLTGVIYAPRVMASGGAAPAVEAAESNDEGDDAAVLAQAKITAEQATAAAAKAYPGATVGEASLENENGTPTYSVLVTNGGKQLDVKVSALTGQVVRAEDDQDGE